MHVFHLTILGTLPRRNTNCVMQKTMSRTHARLIIPHVGSTIHHESASEHGHQKRQQLTASIPSLVAQQVHNAFFYAMRFDSFLITTPKTTYINYR
jgi:hypothetical protein